MYMYHVLLQKLYHTDTHTHTAYLSPLGESTVTAWATYLLPLGESTLTACATYLSPLGESTVTACAVPMADMSPTPTLVLRDWMLQPSHLETVVAIMI